MIDALNFVKGAVGKRDFLPALTHFRIADGFILGYNGKLSLCSPIALDIDCCPKGDTFVRAVEACTETAQLHLTPSGKLAIRSGKFRAHIECIAPEQFPEVIPAGQSVKLHGDLLPSLKLLSRFIGDDASRPWAMGILLDGHSAFATNNIVLAECWLEYLFPYRVVIPALAIKEMLRIGEEPESLQFTAISMTAHYKNGRWLHTQLVAGEWPDVRALLAEHASTGAGSPIDAQLWVALETLKPFLRDDGCLWLSPQGSISTQADEGASIDCSYAMNGKFNHKMLSLLEDAASTINWTKWPAPVPWYGNGIRGLIIGMSPQAGQ